MTFIVQTDNGQRVIERQRTNDTLAGGPTLIQVPPLPELQVTSVTAPPAAFSGQNTAISWTVANGGAGATVQGFWYDSVYLSPTNVFDTNAVLLGYQPHSGALASGGNYSVNNFPVTLPVGISGNYYFLVVADNNQQVYELSRANSTGASSPATQVLLAPAARSRRPASHGPKHNLFRPHFLRHQCGGECGCQRDSEQ